MIGEISLEGGGNAQEDYNTLKYFSKNVKKMLYIPLALPTEDYSKCLDWCKKHFSRFKIDDIIMLDNVSLDLDLNKFDAIYIGGGNTYKLMKYLKESKYDKKLIEYYNQGGKIGGGSAGAIIFGANINISLICKDKDENKVNLKDVSGLNLCFGWDIQAHYKDSHLEINKTYVKKNNRKIIAIPENSSVVILENKFKVVGNSPITLIYKNKEKQIFPKEMFTL